MTNIKSYRSPKTEVREGSTIQGKGLFARELIRQGEIVAVKNGHIIGLDEFRRLEQRCKQYCLQTSDASFIGPRTVEEIAASGIFINHSCNPNVGFKGILEYIAMRDIAAGEELNHDYAMCFTNMEAFPDFRCSCGSDMCRGTITENDWQLKELQQRYGNYFARFILEKIKVAK